MAPTQNLNSAVGSSNESQVVCTEGAKDRQHVCSSTKSQIMASFHIVMMQNPYSASEGYGRR